MIIIIIFINSVWAYNRKLPVAIGLGESHGIIPNSVWKKEHRSSTTFHLPHIAYATNVCLKIRYREGCVMNIRELKAFVFQKLFKMHI